MTHDWVASTSRGEKYLSGNFGVVY